MVVKEMTRRLDPLQHNYLRNNLRIFDMKNHNEYVNNLIKGMEKDNVYINDSFPANSIGKPDINKYHPKLLDLQYNKNIKKIMDHWERLEYSAEKTPLKKNWTDEKKIK